MACPLAKALPATPSPGLRKSFWFLSAKALLAATILRQPSAPSQSMTEPREHFMSPQEMSRTVLAKSSRETTPAWETPYSWRLSRMESSSSSFSQPSGNSREPAPRRSSGRAACRE
jgi:hypothetical protein